MDGENQKLKKPKEDMQGKIEFRNVCFSYPSRPKELILQNLKEIF